MWKNRIGYGSIVLAIGILLFYSGRPFLLWMLTVMLVLPLGMAGMLRRDARYLNVFLKMQTGAKAGDVLLAELVTASEKNIFSAGSVRVQMSVANRMFGTEKEKLLLLEPLELNRTYQIKEKMQLCGETVIQCESVRAYDLLKLFSVEIQSFPEVRTMIYPEQVNLELELEQRMEGSLSEEGMNQNRKGNDPSEMFDIREYVPGDDIRSIHWKLSSKTDGLILRQPSAAMHYQVALMPDFGKDQKEQVTAQEWNTAAAVLAAAGEQLIKMGVPFCMLIPVGAELEVTEIKNQRELRMALSKWLGSPIQKHSGSGIRYFQMTHMEQYFNRLLIVAAGREYPKPEMQMEQMRLIWFIITGTRQNLQIGRWKNTIEIEIPAEEKNEYWHVIC